MKIGILLTGHTPDTLLDEFGDYDQMFRTMLDGHGFAFETFAVVDGEFPGDADAADGWLITGSRHGAYDDLPWIARLEDLIRSIHDRGLPLIGVCFGHQVIATALGGRVEKFAGGWALGRTDYDLNGTKLSLNAWHQDQVTRRPQGARVLVGNAFCENAILAYGDTIWTVQPHPEFGAGFIRGLMRTRGTGVIPEDQLRLAGETLDGPVANGQIADHMAAFFLKERA